jgi:hypothetical protein
VIPGLTTCLPLNSKYATNRNPDAERPSPQGSFLAIGRVLPTASGHPSVSPVCEIEDAKESDDDEYVAATAVLINRELRSWCIGVEETEVVYDDKRDGRQSTS